MTPRVYISAKTAQVLVSVFDFIESRGAVLKPNSMAEFPQLCAALDELRAALNPKPKKFVRLARSRKAKKQRTKRQETADIREAVMTRADGRCECCDDRFGAFNPAELDHQFGRVRVKQSERNTWALCRECHRSKTRNEDGAAYWLERFVEHCKRHGFTEEALMARRRLAMVEAKEKLAVAR